MNKVSVILKVVDYCNFSCEFCRYSKKNDELCRKMTIDTAISTISKAANYNIKNGINYLYVIFHGGEPFLWGIDNFRKIFSFQNTFKKDNNEFVFLNSIQTNGSLISAEWINLFLENNVSVGVSIDGPDEINFHKGKIKKENVLEKIRLIQSSKLNFGILSVITNSHKGKAADYYNFLRTNSIKSVGLCYCYDPEGVESVTNENLSSFLIELFDLYFYGRYRFRVREFDCVIKKTLGYQTNNCAFDCRKNCGNYFSVFPNGDIHFCDSYEYKMLTLGNIMFDDFYDIKKSANFIDITKQLNKNYDNYCRQCDILKYCGGGCFRNDNDNGKNYFCNTYKEVYNHIAKVIEKVGEEEQA